MKIYLVGGAVRDKLLGLPVQERDWVVVGSTPQQMLDLGYAKVGKDFPVFLHPKTKEEYALARQERKTGVGYYGFDCEYNNSITIEEDLLRRDLTINAMAIDADGRLVDPYNGQDDLQNKILRHVSDAFVEDPLRLLRVARFAARFHYLGFEIAKETQILMRKLVSSGELLSLVKERVWQELQKSLLENNPEIFFCILRECGALLQLFPEIDRLFGIPATKAYHPEIDTGVHTLMVLNRAAKSSNKLNVRFAALVHDLGKGVVAKNIWPSHTKHDELGCDIIDKLCSRYKVPTKLRRFAIIVSRLHLQIHKVFELSPEAIVDTLERADVFRNHDLLLDLLLVSEADSMGRGFCGDYPKIPWFFPNYIENDLNDFEYKQSKLWLKILDNCKKIQVDSFVEEGWSGEEIKSQLRKQRINCVKNTLENWKQNEK